MLERILDSQGNPIGITTLYHDPNCGVYFNNCFIRSFSQERTIFQYEDGRMKEFTNYLRLTQFAQHLTPLPNPDQQRFSETQLRAKILEKENKNKPAQDSQEESIQDRFRTELVRRVIEMDYSPLRGPSCPIGYF